MNRRPPRSRCMGLLIAALALTAAAPLLTGCERSSAEDPHTKDANAANNDGSEQTSSEGSSESPHLAPLMGELQRYSQKLGYAIEGENQRLADFYMHEIDAVLSEIEAEVPVYSGIAIPEYVRALMRPSVEPVGQAIDAEDWEQAQQRYEAMISACNACHNATDFGFIKITPASGDPPFNQTF